MKYILIAIWIIETSLLEYVSADLCKNIGDMRAKWFISIIHTFTAIFIGVHILLYVGGSR